MKIHSVARHDVLVRQVHGVQIFGVEVIVDIEVVNNRCNNQNDQEP